MTDKKKILSLVMEELAKQKRDLAARVAEAQQHAREAPTPMESHSDRTRDEMHALAGNLQELIARYEAAEKTLRAFMLPEGEESIVLGSLVGIENAKKMPSNVFLLPGVGNIAVKLNDAVYAAISPETPLGMALMGHRVGERVTVNGREISIVSVE